MFGVVVRGWHIRTHNNETLVIFYSRILIQFKNHNDNNWANRMSTAVNIFARNF